MTTGQHHYLLLTGATGFLGTQIARRLLRETDLTLFALVRAENQIEANRRLMRVWWDWPEMISAINQNNRIKIIPGDVSLPFLGLDANLYAELVKTITHIIHGASNLRIDAPINELRKTNVQGTRNILELAHRTHQDHGLERYSHISTAYVAGRRRGPVAETDLSAENGFSNAYEQSKYEGECLVRAAKIELPISIFRPGMIVGASDTGEIRTFNTFYFPLRLYLSGKLSVIPVDPNLPVNIVPVDYVAKAVTRLTFLKKAEGLTFHLTAPTASLPRAGELVNFIRDWAKDQLDLHLPFPLFIPLPVPGNHPYRELTNSKNPKKSLKIKKTEFSGIFNLLPYFNEHKQFQRDNVERLLGPCQFKWREFMPRLLGFAVEKGFMHRSERTVHEQVLTRLKSRTRSITFYDVVQRKIIKRNSAKVLQEICAAAGALTSLGVEPGDRVAIVGLNSSRYLTLDTAIGLIGAVSVPLYYTSPPSEVSHILASSGSKLLLIGAPKIRERLPEIHGKLPVVDFCREFVPESLQGKVISWQNFLSLGADIKQPLPSPVDFDDLATLRYTSGTTGNPKGVCFQHQHLRWMAETMASLLPWKLRTGKANYLSFLPLNHVTEGILATYSAYYMPTSASIYFLEDFSELKHVLPMLRPGIFFSVPRIYERIWESLELNPLGRFYLDLPKNVLKRVLGGFLRRQTLRKAGLDRCTQLIAGSAPCSEKLLENFRELGIEIHNAYGLTEAPLISMNRMGRNRLGTVGEPLPKTSIRVADDGEILVRGPQVMAGYFNQNSDPITQPFSDGWLRTGDLGYLTSEGSLVVNGRKKDLYKTSYGKYVQPLKIESLLRQIPGVAEAMLVAEGRPFCAALLWIQPDSLNHNGGRLIDTQIQQINHNLSHPEQIRRWAILANDLRIETGDLTANLKLRRQQINQRFSDVIEGLYQRNFLTDKVLYTGQLK